MSFILDALRKSEAQRRLGQTPTLEQPPAGDDSHPVARSGSRWLAVLSVLALLGALLWVNVDRWSPREAGSLTAVSDSLPADSKSNTKEAHTKETRADPPQAASLAAERMPPTETIARQPAARQPTPLENYQAPSVSLPSGVSRPSTPNSDAEPAAASPAASGSGQPAAVADEPAAAAEQPPAAVGTQPLRWYELPNGVRDRLGRLRVSMRVYNPDSALRFAIVNGKRMLEGDTLASGAVLAEIGRERVVFEFDNYRFFID